MNTFEQITYTISAVSAIIGIISFFIKTENISLKKKIIFVICCIFVSFLIYNNTHTKTSDSTSVKESTKTLFTTSNSLTASMTNSMEISLANTEESLKEVPESKNIPSQTLLKEPTTAIPNTEVTTQIELLETTQVISNQYTPETEPVTQIDTTTPLNEAVQYSYRTRSKEYKYITTYSPQVDGWTFIGTETVLSDEWGLWSDWSINYIQSSKNIEVQQRNVDTGMKQQIFLGRYYSESENAFFPTKKNDTYEFEGGWFDEEQVTFKGQVYKGGRDDCYEVQGYHYYFFKEGEHAGETREVPTGTQIEYRYRERLTQTLYKFGRDEYGNWSSWSDWSDVPRVADDITDVKTRTIWR